MQPKRTKYRKQFKGRNDGMATRGNKVSFGDFGIKSCENGLLNARQIEAARVALSRHIKRGGKIWIRIFPDKPITKKPLEVRQGSGKGNVEYWAAKVQAGTMLLEIGGVDEATAREALKLAGSKLPLKTQFIVRTIM